MQLIVDTNILLSAIIKNSNSRLILLHPSFEFFMPEYALEEFIKHRDVIVRKSGLKPNDLDILTGLIFENVITIPISSFAKHISRAQEIMNDIDPNDSPFIALALSFQNDGIWTQDKDFDRQSVIRVWKTHQLLEVIKEGRIR